MDFAALQAVHECSGAARAPSHTDQVFKDECMFSFDTPLSAGGLYISLNTWQAFGQDYVTLDHNRTGNRLYLQEIWHKASIGCPSYTWLARSSQTCQCCTSVPETPLI